MTHYTLKTCIFFKYLQMESGFQCWGSIAELSTLKFSVFTADTKILLRYHQLLPYCHTVLRVNNKYFTLNVHMSELFELRVLNGEIILSDEFFSPPKHVTNIFMPQKIPHTFFFYRVRAKHSQCVLLNAWRCVGSP